MYQKPDANRVEPSHRMDVQTKPDNYGATPSDDFNENAHGVSTATRNRPRDSVAFATEPTTRSWTEQIIPKVKKA